MRFRHPILPLSIRKMPQTGEKSLISCCYLAHHAAGHETPVEQFGGDITDSVPLLKWSCQFCNELLAVTEPAVIRITVTSRAVGSRVFMKLDTTRGMTRTPMLHRRHGFGGIGRDAAP